MTAGRFYVGRERELTELTGRLDALATGGANAEGAVVLLGGEPGIGKTRLCEELARAAAARGATVAWGSAWDGGGAPAYWPWTQIVRSLATQGAAPAALPVELAPLLGAAGGDGTGAAGQDVEAARFRLFDAIGGFLRAAATRAPLVLVLDDLHQADRASLLLLAFVARELRTLRVLVLGTFRDVELRLRPEAGELLSKVARAGARVTLPPLDREQVRAFVAHHGGGTGSDALVAELHRATAGNPLYLDETLRLLAARALASWPNVGPLPVPDGVKDVIRGRVALFAEARDTLDAAAAAGYDFSPVVLAGALDRPADGVRAQLEIARTAGLMTAAPGDRLAFAHPLIRETIYQDLGARRFALHARLGRELARRHDDGADVPLREIAHHFVEAADAGSAAETAAWVLRAIARAMQVYAFDQAAALGEQALAVLAPLPCPDDARLELVLAHAEALLRAGQRQRSRERCEQAAELARARGDAVGLARAALVLGADFNLGVVDRVLVARLEEAIGRLGDRDDGLRARLMARLAAAQQPAIDPREPVALARAALALARRVGDDDTLIAVLLGVGSAFGDYVGPAERAEVNRELVERARARGRSLVAMRAQARLFVDRLELEDVAGADACIEGYEQLAREFHQPHYRWLPLLMRAERALMSGRAAEARRLSDEAAAIGASLEDPNALRTTGIQRVAVLHAGGDRAELLAHVGVMATVVADAESLGAWIHLWGAWLHATAGDLEATRAERALLPASIAPLATDVNGLAMLAVAVIALRDLEACEEVLGMLRPYAHLSLSHGLLGLIWSGPTTLLLGRLARALGREDEAIPWFRDALARCERIGALPLAEEARRELAAAPALAAAATAPLTAPTPAALVPGEVPFELRREGEVWTVLCRGRTLRLKHSRGLEILDRLVREPGRELHVLDLVAASADGEGFGVIDAGDAGELLDDTAKASYRQRLAELDEELAQADAWADRGRAERLRDEREQLARELARGVGLGGRDRRAGQAAERARVNVQRRLRDVMKRIEEFDAELGRHLAWAVRTGSFCSYRRA